MSSVPEVFVVESTVTGLNLRPPNATMGLVSSLSELNKITSSSLGLFLCPSSPTSLPRFLDCGAVLVRVPL